MSRIKALAFGALFPWLLLVILSVWDIHTAPLLVFGSTGLLYAVGAMTYDRWSHRRHAHVDRSN
ncbi:MAG: hypothetical protein ACLFWH_11165 [Actinomycetota bacterium]